MFGILIDYIVWWVVAALISYIATAEGANIRSYSLLTTRLQQLKARFKEIDLSKNAVGSICNWPIINSWPSEKSVTILQILKVFSISVLWGYNGYWVSDILMRGGDGSIVPKEALIEVEPVEMAICGALHDKLAIQELNLSSRKELLMKLRQAVKELYPAMESSFTTYQPQEDNEEIHKLKKSIKQHPRLKSVLIWMTTSPI